MSPPSSTFDRQIILLGTGTSTGVPLLGCQCPVCQSTDPRNHRTRTGVLVQGPGGNFLIDASPELRLQLLREKIGMIEAALLTHEHPGPAVLRRAGRAADQAGVCVCVQRPATEFERGTAAV
jgi:hypothetical protein